MGSLITPEQKAERAALLLAVWALKDWVRGIAEMHPSGCGACLGWIHEAFEAADHCDAAKVEKLTVKVRLKVAQELSWFRESKLTARGHHG